MNHFLDDCYHQYRVDNLANLYSDHAWLCVDCGADKWAEAQPVELLSLHMQPPHAMGRLLLTWVSLSKRALTISYKVCLYRAHVLNVQDINYMCWLFCFFHIRLWRGLFTQVHWSRWSLVFVEVWVFLLNPTSTEKLCPLISELWVGCCKENEQ